MQKEVEVKEKDESYYRDKYGCDGYCYGGYKNGNPVPVCEEVDNCPEPYNDGRDYPMIAIAFLIVGILVGFALLFFIGWAIIQALLSLVSFLLVIPCFGVV